MNVQPRFLGGPFRNDFLTEQKKNKKLRKSFCIFYTIGFCSPVRSTNNAGVSVVKLHWTARNRQTQQYSFQTGCIRAANVQLYCVLYSHTGSIPVREPVVIAFATIEKISEIIPFSTEIYCPRKKWLFLWLQLMSQSAPVSRSNPLECCWGIDFK